MRLSRRPGFAPPRAQARVGAAWALGGLLAGALVLGARDARATPTAASGPSADGLVAPSAMRFSSADAGWRAIQQGRRRWSDLESLSELLAFRTRWPDAHRAEADAQCIAHALRIGHAGWQRQCWLDGFAWHGWSAGASEAATDAIVGALLHGDSRLALEYSRELEQTPGWASQGAGAAGQPTLAWQRARYWQARAAAANGHPTAALYFAEVIEAAPLSYYGLAATLRADPAGYAAAVRREVGAVLARAPDASGSSCDLLDCDELLGLHWRQYGRLDPMRLPRARLASLPGPVLRAAFPLRYAVEVHAASLASGVPQSWLLAIGRRESHFRPGAVSPVGARGLMQMLPSTARIYRARLAAAGEELHGSLSDPSTNLRLAAAMLSELSAAHGGAIEVVAAAYCTGPGRVAGWRRRFAPAEADLWVEVVPYRAVRDYVREVAAAASIYAVRMGETAPAVGAALRAPPG